MQVCINEHEHMHCNDTCAPSVIMCMACVAAKCMCICVTIGFYTIIIIMCLTCRVKNMPNLGPRAKSFEYYTVCLISSLSGGAC